MEASKFVNTPASSFVFCRDIVKNLRKLEKERNGLSQFHFVSPLIDLWIAIEGILVETSSSALVEDSIELFAVFYGGAFVPAKDYISVCSKICDNVGKLSSGRVHLRILIIPLTSLYQFIAVNVFPIALVGSVLRYLGKLSHNKRPLAPGELWMFGHSAGAFFGIDLAMKHLKGCISFSCVKSNCYSLTRKPVLQIVSGRDGFLPVSVAAKLISFGDGLGPKLLQGLGSYNAVLVAFGVNHMQVASGRTSKSTERTHRADLESSVALADAHDLLAGLAADFLLLQVADAPLTVKSRFIHNRQLTHEFMEPFLRALDPSADRQIVHHWHQFLLKQASVNVSASLLNEALECSDIQAFSIARGFVECEEETGRLLLSSPFLRMNAVEGLLSYTERQFSMHRDCQHIGSILAIKSSIALLDNTALGDEATTAARFNNSVFANALATVPSAVQEHYQQSGRKLVFSPDTATMSEFEWLQTCVKVGKLNHVLEAHSLSSPTYRGERGELYAKVISSGFALEWIYVWSHRS